jgi:hypothetical protein
MDSPRPKGGKIRPAKKDIARKRRKPSHHHLRRTSQPVPSPSKPPAPPCRRPLISLSLFAEGRRELLQLIKKGDKEERNRVKEE